MIIEAIGSYFTMKKKSGSVDLNRLAFEAGYGQV
jgi:hypothetical protein